MSKDNSNTGFEVIALSNIKTKNTAKEGSLNDLFKCVTDLANSTESLRDYVSSISEEKYKENISKYLTALSKIQDGLLEIAQENIRKLSQMPSPASIDPAMSDDDSKIGK